MVSSRPIHPDLLNPRRIDDFEADYSAGDSDDDADGSLADDPPHQLQHLADEDPEAAATVVQRWITEK
jgi:flagellar biosynthesis/type III secretory pathway M-ring protein FliF/YscJ